MHVKSHVGSEGGAAPEVGGEGETTPEVGSEGRPAPEPQNQEVESRGTQQTPGAAPPWILSTSGAEQAATQQ